MTKLLNWLAGALLIAAAIGATAYIASLAETAYFERTFER